MQPIFIGYAMTPIIEHTTLTGINDIEQLFADLAVENECDPLTFTPRLSQYSKLEQAMCYSRFYTDNKGQSVTITVFSCDPKLN